ncbi:MAG: formimidoylglutamase [Pseudomonadota bacterium]
MSVRRTTAPPWDGRDDTEDGDAARRLYHCCQDAGRTALLGFACDAGVARNQGRSGAAEGPTSIRNALANLAAPARSTTFTDLGDIAVRHDDLEDGQALLSSTVAQALKQHQRLIVLGGGHETALGSYRGLVSAAPDAKIGIINLDAHLDLRTPAPHGGSSGTPFFEIRSDAPTMFDYLCIGVAQESNTPALFDRAKDWGVAVVSDRAISEDVEAADRYIDSMVARNDLIYLTIDLDVLPHYQAPGVSAPATRGVALSTIERIIDRIVTACGDNQLRLADVVECAPAYDRDGVTARTAAYLVRQLLVK